MKYSDLVRGKFYCSDFVFQDKPSKVILRYDGSQGEARHMIDALGKYKYSTCCNENSQFREATPKEEALLQGYIQSDQPSSKENKKPQINNSYIIF